MSKKDPLEAAVDAMSDNSLFWPIVQSVWDRRESAIRELQTCADGGEKKLAGAIGAYDDVLLLLRYEDVLRKSAAVT